MCPRQFEHRPFPELELWRELEECPLLPFLLENLLVCPYEPSALPSQSARARSRANFGLLDFGIIMLERKEGKITGGVGR